MTVMHTGTTVRAPDGAVWQIKIRWMPRWHALARRFGGWRDNRRESRPVSRASDWIPDPTTLIGSNCGTGGGGSGWFDFDFDFGDGLLGALVAIVTVIAAGLLIWWVLLPLMLLVLDAAIVIVLLVAGIVGRVLLHRPWTLEATSESGRRYTRQAVGWRNARTEIAALAGSISSGTAAVLELNQVPV